MSVQPHDGLCQTTRVPRPPAAKARCIGRAACRWPQHRHGTLPWTPPGWRWRRLWICSSPIGSWSRRSYAPREPLPARIGRINDPNHSKPKVKPKNTMNLKVARTAQIFVPSHSIMSYQSLCKHGHEFHTCIDANPYSI